MDKDCELQKITAFDSYLAANVNAQYTFLACGLIGMLVIVLTLFNGGVFDIFNDRFLVLIPLAVMLVGVFYSFRRIR